MLALTFNTFCGNLWSVLEKGETTTMMTKREKIALGVAAALAAIGGMFFFAKKRKESHKLSGKTGDLALQWGEMPGGELPWTIRPSER